MAEGVAEHTRRKARGEADAIYARMEAEARGAREILEQQAKGIAALVSAAAGDPQAAVQLMIADKLEELTRIQVDAISNLKIDKVTVWDNGAQDGKSSTAGFVSGLMRAIPPMQDLFKQAGLEMPSYLGTPIKQSAEPTLPDEQ